MYLDDHRHFLISKELLLSLDLDLVGYLRTHLILFSSFVLHEEKQIYCRKTKS